MIDWSESPAVCRHLDGVGVGKVSRRLPDEAKYQLQLSRALDLFHVTHQTALDVLQVETERQTRLVPTENIHRDMETYRHVQETDT